MPPSPGLNTALYLIKSVEPYSPKGPENVKIRTHYRRTGIHFRAATRHNTATAVAISQRSFGNTTVADSIFRAEVFRAEERFTYIYILMTSLEVTINEACSDNECFSSFVSVEHVTYSVRQVH